MNKITCKRKKRKKKVFLLLLRFTAVLYIFSLITAGLSIEKIKPELIKSSAASLFERAAYESVSDSIKLINDLEKDSDGYFIKAADIAMLQAQISRNMEKKINASKINFIPSGNFTGIYLFEGIGFPIPVKVSFMGSAKAVLDESFESGGVNQTLYTLKLYISGVMYTNSIKYRSEAISLSTEYVLLEKIIKGSVPSYFQARG